MLVNQTNFEGTVIKNNETYFIEDNTTLNNLVLSKTVLHEGKQTSGHFHEGIEEVYFFHVGSGVMTLGDMKYVVMPGDIMLIPDGVYHRVENCSEGDLIFSCVFQSYVR